VQIRYCPAEFVSVVAKADSPTVLSRFTVAPAIGLFPSGVVSKTTPENQMDDVGIDCGAPTVDSNVFDTTLTSKVVFPLRTSDPAGHGAR